MKSKAADTSLKKIAATAAHVLSGIVTAFFLFLLAFLLYSLAAAKNDGGGIGIGPYAYMAVVSGSMEPAISAGDVIVTKQGAPDTVSPGDIITFHPYAGSVARVTHRVVEITQEGFLTMGDANDARDVNPVTPQMYIGKVFLIIPYIGFLMSGSAGPILVGSIFLLYVIVEAAVKELIKGRHRRRERSAARGTEAKI